MGPGSFRKTAKCINFKVVSHKIEASRSNTCYFMFIEANRPWGSAAVLMCVVTYLLFGDVHPLSTYVAGDPPIESTIRIRN
jgi:hypothetical protein